jgi:hypothetical protein
LDSISRPEFHEIFDRVSVNIDLAGCINALAIEHVLEEARDRSKDKFKIGRGKARRAEYGRQTEWLDTLIEHDFAGRATFEARLDPRGTIALTLIHGRQEAQRIMAQRKASLRSRLTYRPIPRVPIVPKKVPELRRKPTYRRHRRERPRE